MAENERSHERADDAEHTNSRECPHERDHRVDAGDPSVDEQPRNVVDIRRDAGAERCKGDSCACPLRDQEDDHAWEPDECATEEWED